MESDIQEIATHIGFMLDSSVPYYKGENHSCYKGIRNLFSLQWKVSTEQARAVLFQSLKRYASGVVMTLLQHGNLTHRKLLILFIPLKKEVFARR